MAPRSPPNSRPIASSPRSAGRTGGHRSVGPIGRIAVELRAGTRRVPVVVTRAAVGPIADDDRRLLVLMHVQAYRSALDLGWFGLHPAILPDPPEPDSNGNITVELRLIAPGGDPVGATNAELRSWVDGLASGTGSDLAVESWMITAIGGTAPEQRTLWHHLASLPSVDADPVDDPDAPNAQDDPDESVFDTTIESVVAYLRDQAPDGDVDLDLDSAGELLSSWLAAGSIDPARALDATRRDLAGTLGMAAPTDPSELAEHLAATWVVLVDDGAQPALVDEGRGIVYAVAGEHGNWHGVIEQRDADTVVVYSLVPVELPTDRFVDAMELTLRLNEGLTTSTFDLDVESGEMAVRTGVDLSDRPPRSAEAVGLLRRSIHTNAAVLDDHLAAVVAFCNGETVSDALALLG